GQVLHDRVVSPTLIGCRPLHEQIDPDDRVGERRDMIEHKLADPVLLRADQTYIRFGHGFSPLKEALHLNHVSLHLVLRQALYVGAWMRWQSGDWIGPRP